MSTNENIPIIIDLRENSNTAGDYCLFLKMAIKSGYFDYGDYLIYDNATVHCGDVFQEISEICGEYGIITIPTPKYSPELNPIELAFQRVKHHLRYNRGDGALIEEIVNAFATIDHSFVVNSFLHCANYFTKCPLALPPEFNYLVQ